MKLITAGDIAKFDRCPESFIHEARSEEYDPHQHAQEQLEKITEHPLNPVLARELSGGYMVTGAGELGQTQTTELINLAADTILNATVALPEGQLTVVDAIKHDPDSGSWDIFQTNSRSEIGRHQLVKSAFARVALRDAGIEVGKSFILTSTESGSEITEVTECAEGFEKTIEEKLEDIKLIMGEWRDRALTSCGCWLNRRSNRCDNFTEINTDTADDVVYGIPYMSRKKLQAFLESGVRSIHDICEDAELSAKQWEYVNVQQSGEPLIKIEAIAKMLEGLTDTIHFIDYETYEGPLPAFNGQRPFETAVFQYSLHTLNEDGTIGHNEYLAIDRDSSNTLHLIESMRQNMDDQNTVVVWNKKFEATRNEELAKLHPEHAEFLLGMNDRMFDLMDVFGKRLYQHPEFKGYYSLKRVLPVLCPWLSYDELEIQDGLTASNEWFKAVNSPDGLSAEAIQDALEYCRLDTFGMVEIYRVLIDMIPTNDLSSTLDM